jgi:hypothetical protein
MAIFLALSSPLMLGIPGSENNPIDYALIAGFWVAPIVFSWTFYLTVFRDSRRNFILALSLIAGLLVYFIVLGVIESVLLNGA